MIHVEHVSQDARQASLREQFQRERYTAAALEGEVAALDEGAVMPRHTRIEDW